MSNPSESSPESDHDEIVSVDMGPDVFCLWCNHLLDAASDTEQAGNVPTNGDISICLYCGDLAVYEVGEADRLSLRAPTKQEREEALADEQIQKVMVARALTGVKIPPRQSSLHLDRPPDYYRWRHSDQPD